MNDPNKPLDLGRARKLLYDLADAWAKPLGGNASHYEVENWRINLFEQVQKIIWYVNELKGCDFQSENGVKCNDRAEREVYGIWCCEHHAKIREMY